MSDAAGQPAGLVLNCVSVHAFCNVVNRDGSCLGSSTLTRAMFAWVPNDPAGSLTVAVRLAPFALLVFLDVETVNLGSNFRLEQSAAWNGVLTVTGSPSAGLAGSAPAPVIVSVIDSGAQLVGLTMNFSRSM